MKDVQIHTFLQTPQDRGGAYYDRRDGIIYIGKDSMYNIVNILWHEIIHKILYEENIIETPQWRTFDWDNIAFEIEDFLFNE